MKNLLNLKKRPWKQHKLYEKQQCEQQLELEQALISKKDFKDIDDERKSYIVNREYVNSKEYHDKFEKLPLSPQIQQALYKQAGRLLEFVDGQPEERLLAINARTGELIVDNFERKGETTRTRFDKTEKEKIKKCKDSVIYMHNHSYNGRPSAADIIFCIHGLKLSSLMVVCHNGTIYNVSNVKPEVQDLYENYYTEEKKRIGNKEIAKSFATTRLYEHNDKVGNRHKLFKIIKL